MVAKFPFLFKVILISFVFIATVACGSDADNKRLILATTTSTQDSGLLDVLVPRFEEESGYTVQTVAVGTGAALRMAEEGNADVLLVHAPSAEKTLMSAGYGKDRLLVMHNDFVIVGPIEDMARISGGMRSAEAFTSIAESDAIFVSRGDDSGTNKKELAIWQTTTLDPNRTKPNWYIESGQGMGATLIIASEKSAYTLTDRATFLANQHNLDLTILVEGDESLLNIYHVITVNPDKWPNIDYAGALAFANFLTSESTQNTIATFGTEQFGQPLFFPDARQ